MYSRPLPLSQWQQHVSAMGQPYLHNAITGEVRWLYSRFHDSATQRDYLVNIVTNERIWATPENSYLCPKPDDWTPQSSSNNPTAAATASVASARAGGGSGSSTNAMYMQNQQGHGAMPARPPPAARPARDAYPASHPQARRQPPGQPDTGTRKNAPTRGNIGLSSADRRAGGLENGRGNKNTNVASKANISGDRHTHKLQPDAAPSKPDSLALGADEVLMVDSRTSRRYIFNRRTRQSRWLTDAETSGATDARGSGHDGANGFSPTGSPALQNNRPQISSTEAALNIQRAIRGSAVRRLKTLDKLRALGSTLHEIDTISGETGSHNLEVLRSVISGIAIPGMTRKDASQKLLELGEYCTQRMLEADAVNTGGIAFVRRQRKMIITRILEMIEQIDGLRAKVRDAGQ